MPSEADIQNAIIEALIFDGWLVLRINQGGRHGGEVCPECFGQSPQLPALICYRCNSTGKVGGRYTRFAHYRVLGIEPTDKGISDVLAIKTIPKWCEDRDGADVPKFVLLVIEVKAPGKKSQCPTCQGSGIEQHSVGTSICNSCKGEGAYRVKKKPTKAQQQFLDEVEAHGGIPIVADCLEDVQPYLDRITTQ